MGEWSKTVGEFGEKTVENFLTLIGWGNPPKGLTLDCIRKSDHIIDKKVKERQTHGIDFLYNYLCPLVDGTLKNIVIQVKYTAEAYPNYPSSKFKEYIRELAYTLDCFKKSALKADHSKYLNGYNKIEDVGILIWLSHNSKSEDGYDDLISQVANVQFSEDFNYHSIYLVDNKRLGFIFESISFIKKQFQNYDFSFFYPDTGKNLNPIFKQNSGKILPAQYINTSILPLRIQNLNNKEEIILALFSIDPFSLTDLNRLIGLSQSLSNNWSSKILIAFPDFDNLHHENEVRNAFMNFKDKSLTEKIKVISFRSDFRNN